MSKLNQHSFHLFYFAGGILIALLLVFNACRNEDVYRITKIRTDDIVNVTDTSAVATGVIIDIGEGISEYGFCWNSSGNPTIDDAKLSYTNAQQTGQFTGIISGLNGGTTYYINTYANNGKEIIYGEEKLFTCIEGLPKVNTDEITNIGKASLNGKGIITSDGGQTILAKGFIWSSMENPVIGRLDGFTDEPGDTTTFLSEIKNLVPDKTFYIRAYATNENGTGYGEVKMINTLPAESGDYIWANYYGSYNHEESSAICSDASGNIYVTGRYKDYTTIGDQTINAQGGYDIFISKYNENGELIWLTGAGGIEDDNSYDICVDTEGNLYITGIFRNSITFGTTTLNSSGQDDLFIAKYDNSGNSLWAKSAGGTSTDKGKAVATDPNGNVYLSGSSSSTSITFGAYTLGSFIVFTVKYDDAGNVLWAREIDKDESNGICTDDFGNVYITGSIAVVAVVGAQYSEVFVTKYSQNGTLQWTNQPTSAQLDDRSSGICVDKSGNIYMSGHSGNITFAGQPIIISAGGFDVFVAKYNSSGTVLWAKSVRGSKDEYGGGIAVDASDNVYITGSYFSESLAFDTDTIANDAYADIFYAKYSTTGELLTVKSANGTVNDFGNDVCTFDPDFVYLAGYANSRFLNLDYFTVENKGRNDLTIAKIKQ